MPPNINSTANTAKATSQDVKRIQIPSMYHGINRNIVCDVLQSRGILASVSGINVLHSIHLKEVRYFSTTCNRQNEANNLAVNPNASGETSATVESGGNIVATEAVNSGENSKELILDFLPERPTPIEAGTSAEYLGLDPPLSSLGLATWWPPGRMQCLMEYIHSGAGLDIPWWGTILISKFIG